MSIILVKASYTEQAVKGAGLLMPVHQANLTGPKGQILI